MEVRTLLAIAYVALLFICAARHLVAMPAGSRLRAPLQLPRSLLLLHLAGLLLALSHPPHKAFPAFDSGGCLRSNEAPMWPPGSAAGIAPAVWRQGSVPPAGGDSPHFVHAGALERLKALGFSPDTILDVGANAGDWARGVWGVWGASVPLVLMVEGFEEHAGALEATGFPFVVSLAGALPRLVDFYVSAHAHTGNSVFRENSKHAEEFLPQQRPVRTLDQLVASYASGTARPQLLKLDVQGYELEVLKGATGVLASVEVLLVETSIVQWNSGAPLTAEVLGVLDCLGFQVLDVLDTARLQGHAIQVDFLLVRKGSPLLERAHQALGVGKGKEAGKGEGP
jgi:FkbM family methyltransferase